MADKEKYHWQLSPSRFEASKGCACFEDEPFIGTEYKDRGTDLHEYMEHPERSTAGLPPDDAEAVQFCRDFDAKIESLYGPFAFRKRELYIPKTNMSPGGKLDYVLVTTMGRLIVIDYKFGAMEVVKAEDNAQVKAYVLMAWEYITHTLGTPTVDLERGIYGEPETGLPAITGLTGIIVQPAHNLEDIAEFDLGALGLIELELKLANDRVTDPFKTPDPSDGMKCKRCKNAARCPAIATAISTFVERTNLLPMPEQFDPKAVVSIRDRIIAQQLAPILETWAERIKRANREFAIMNGGSLGDVYFITMRGNGVEVNDLAGFAKGLTDAGLMESPSDIMNFVKIQKGKLVEGLTELAGGNAADVKATVAELEEKFGVPRPPVTVFRMGGKKAVMKPLESLGVPMLGNPFKEKGDE